MNSAIATNNPATVLVTGATGLVGSHLLAELSNKNYRIKAIRRASSDLSLVKRIISLYCKNPNETFDSIEWIEGDMLDLLFLESALEGVQTVYHCAAVVSFQPAMRRTMHHFNTKSTSNLVNLLLQKSGITLCHVSSIAALGREEHGLPVTENTLWKSSKNQSAYAVSKYASEREVWRGIAEGLEAVIVNPSVILGPGDWKSGSSELFGLVWRGLDFYTSGKTGYVDVRDVAKAMVQLVENKHFGRRFIISSENMGYREFFKMIAEAFNKRPPRFRIRAWMTEIAWRLVALGRIFSSNMPSVTRETSRSALKRKSYSSERLINTLDFQFIPVEQSIKHIAQLFKEDQQAR